MGTDVLPVTILDFADSGCNKGQLGNLVEAICRNFRDTKSLSVLKNRNVVLFPDLGATTVWQDKLPMMQVLGIRATLFDFLEHQACEEDKAKGLDIADYLLKIKPAEARLQALIKQNPAIRKLIDVFKLEIVDEPQPRFRSPKRQRGFRL